MAAPALHFGLPDSSLFTFPPSREPQTLPSPSAGSTLTAPPLSIPPELYNAVFDARIPITIACIYAVSVTVVNRINKANGNKAWPISKTKPFFWFVVAHNVFLAIYSAWTFVGMFGALARVIASYKGVDGLVGTVDSLCKIHGTSGLGNAITYNTTLSSWISESPSTILLSDAGLPQATDLGRLWNEGLAFYGWFFYLSKFYEVLDTVIILAKGKRSSTLQTYHHAGAMMCMWAGMRYMSPPIWMFVFVNSGIHAMMYTYYTITAFGIYVPQPIKRSLTTMQIIQFLVGASYAMIHSFVSYTIPIQVFSIKEAASSAASAATSVAAAAASTAAAGGVGSKLMKLLYRAAGEEGLAENVNGAYGTEQLAELKSAHHGSGIPEVLYHTEYQRIPCIDTSGQTFAIWLNVFYLTPLTFLFMRFFVKSYIRRTQGQKKRAETKIVATEGAAKDAVKGLERKLEMNGNGKVNGKANGHANGHSNGHAKH